MSTCFPGSGGMFWCLYCFNCKSIPMKTKMTVLSVLIIPLLLLGMVERLQAQNLDLSKSVANITTGGNGVNASQNDVLEYTIIAKNLSSSAFTNSKFYDNIPAGCAYIAGSTKVNSVVRSDAAGGIMPFAATGGPINSPGAISGTLNPNIPAVIKFRVRVTANGGNVTNFGIVECTNQGSNLVQSTNTVFTNLTPDPLCSIVYQCTGQIQSGLPSGSPGYPYRYIRTLNTSTGTGGSVIFDGATGPCYDAVSGGALSIGSVLVYASAIAYDKTSNRIYFVNNNSDRSLCYIDLSASPVCAKRFTGYLLETNASSSFNINRMSFCSDGFGYAVTTNGQDLIRFSINSVTGLPVIAQLGPLLNDVNNAPYDILAESGGDIFGDGSGNLYMVVNSSRLYKINPNTRVSTFLGSINPAPGTNSNAIAVDAAGNVYIGGAYQNVYNVNLASMASASITSGTSNVWTTGDYTSCGFPVLAPALVANKTFHNISGRPDVVGGDTVEYVIEVINTGNLNAAGVKLYDGIPLFTTYVPNSAKMNGNTVADVSGTMPFAVTGGRLINSTNESSGIIKPGAANKVTVSFRAVTLPDTYVCNQSRITLFDMNGNTIFINSNDPSQGSGQNQTCFFSNGILPSNSLKFKASIADDISLLQWSVSDEHNINNYEVQYSTDGTRFTTIGTVNSKGNNTGVNSYQFNDEVNTAAATRYYRLRVVGSRGGGTFSQVLKLGLKSLQVTRIQPNPFDKVVSVQLQLKSAGQLQIRLVDMYGRVVYKSSEQLSKGTHSLGLQMPAGLTPGAYVLELMTGNDDLYQQKLIKR